uniref:Secreted protein n=1 Tax=Ixodes ricinus TaxID=34613 RepID=A0A6B0U2M8_IXORI
MRRCWMIFLSWMLAKPHTSHTKFSPLRCFFMCFCMSASVQRSLPQILQLSLTGASLAAPSTWAFWCFLYALYTVHVYGQNGQRYSSAL